MAVYQYDAQNDSLNRIAGGTLYASIPIGSYIPFGGTAIPTGWLLCNGQAVSRTDYADLFAVIGTAYGSGDGSTTFNIPDLREAVPKGAGLTGLSNNHLDADGLAVGEFLDDRIQNIKIDPRTNGYDVSVWTDDSSTISTSPFTVAQPSPTYGAGGGSGGFKTLGFDASKNVRAGATTEVKSVGSNYIIKAKQIGVPADFVDAIEDVVSDSVGEVISVNKNFNVTTGTAYNYSDYYTVPKGTYIVIAEFDHGSYNADVIYNLSGDAILSPTRNGLVLNGLQGGFANLTVTVQSDGTKKIRGSVYVHASPISSSTCTFNMTLIKVAS